MTDIVKGITESGIGFDSVSWNILDQAKYHTVESVTSFAFRANSQGHFVPVHIHPVQDEVILLQEGELGLKLDGVCGKARTGDLFAALDHLSDIPRIIELSVQHDMDFPPKEANASCR